MKKGNKILVVCLCLAVTGGILSAAGYIMGGRVWGVGFSSGRIFVNTPNVTRGEGVQKWGDSYKEETKALDAFDRMEVNFEYGDISIIPSDHYGISYRVDELYTFDVKVENNCLKVIEKYPQKGFIGFGSNGIYNQGYFAPQKKEYLEIYIPSDSALKKSSLTAGDGDISASGIQAEELQIYNEYGDVSFKNLDCGPVKITLEDGSCELNELKAGALSVYNEYGPISLSAVSAEGLDLTSEDGNITAAALSGSRLAVKQEYGDVELTDVSIEGNAAVEIEDGKMKAKNLAAAEIQITNEYGDVWIEDSELDGGTIKMEDGLCTLANVAADDMKVVSLYGDVDVRIEDDIANYMLTLETDYGRINVNGIKMGETYRSLGTAPKALYISCDDGDITLQEE